MKKGVALDLPAEIAEGIKDVSKRGNWNTAAPKEFALPTEIWREVVTRRQRYQEVRDKLAKGEIHEINDLITYNLDICQFAQDAIENSDDPQLLRAFWYAIAGRVPEKSNQKARQGITVLDPTCGSGAFLFAALNILEPLYDACLERMQGFIDDLKKEKTGSKKFADFRKVLGQVAEHASHRYFILKSIVINNLYGVDIMEEALEICKLRLFLKLVAQLETYDQIEPLPDIDFNIRSGNTLVGFTSLDDIKQAMQGDWIKEQALPEIEERAEIADRAFRKFREMQTAHGMDAEQFHDAKSELRDRLNELRAELDRYLAETYGVNLDHAKKYAAWRSSHQPFHWFVEFFGIMDAGGFDVIIGNPPYVEYRKIQNLYRVLSGEYESEKTANLYSFCMERSSKLIASMGNFGMIVPAGVLGLDDAMPLRKVLFCRFEQLFFSSYSIRPSKLFDGVDQRLCIVLGVASSSGNKNIYTTRYHHWYSQERESLFMRLAYVDSSNNVRLNRIPQIGSIDAKCVLKKMEDVSGKVISDYYVQSATQKSFLMHYHRSPRYWIRAMDFEQYFKSPTRSRSVHHFRDIRFENEDEGRAIGAIINSSLFFFWFVTVGNGRNLTGNDVKKFPVGELIDESAKNLSMIFDCLMNDYKDNSIIRVRKDCEFQEFRPSQSKDIIDDIDIELRNHYEFTKEETDFIKNYEIKYRISLNASSTET